MTMLEKAARAADIAAEYEDAGFYESSYRYVDNWPDVVRAVLDAIRKPDDGMIRAGDDCHTYDPFVATPTAYADVETTFTAMIDHIRKEGIE